MSSGEMLGRERAASAYRHQAFFYASESEFTDRIAAFVRAGVERGEPSLVVIDERKIARLRSRLGRASRGVEFENMTIAGANPARIIPLWHDFLAIHSGRPVRGVGEPIWGGRSGDQLRECLIHEDLLNIAIPADAPMHLLCPYDTSAIDAEVIARAHTTHAADVVDGSVHSPLALFEPPLPEPAGGGRIFERHSPAMSELRRAVALAGARARLDPGRLDGLVTAAHVVATNSLEHGGGIDRVRVWNSSDSVICEIAGSGELADPLAGRRRPGPGLGRGRGLWLANQICDLVQICTQGGGTTVRLHCRIA